MPTSYRIERDPQVCDFCTDPFPVAVFQCSDFIWAKDSPLPHVGERTSQDRTGTRTWCAYR
jgi:hypothetical protein